MREMRPIFVTPHVVSNALSALTKLADPKDKLTQ